MAFQKHIGEAENADLILGGLDFLDEGISVFDSEYRLITWNKAFVRLGLLIIELRRFSARRGAYGIELTTLLITPFLAKVKNMLVQRACEDGKIRNAN